MSHAPFSIPFFTQLVRRLRYANARYDQIARKCRCSQHLTYHAKRQAYRAGLRIDTSKARAPSPGMYASSTASTQLSPAWDGSPAWVPASIETEEISDAIIDDAHMQSVGSMQSGGLAPHRGTVQAELAMVGLSPLELELNLNWNVNDGTVIGGLPAPGAPRWKPRPLPEDDCETKIELASLSCTDNLVYTAASMQLGSLGPTAQFPRRLKRKQRDFERTVFSRKPKRKVQDKEQSFSVV